MPLSTQPPRRPGRPLTSLDLGPRDGPPILLMQGFALQPRTYRRLADRLVARGCRVIIPALFAEPGLSWSPAQVLADVVATLDALELDQVSVIGHSFGGALQLDFAVLWPERTRELVFVDTLAMSREWTLAAEALHPAHLLWMATPQAALDFAESALRHPLCLARAGWWGFRSDRREQVAILAGTSIPRHVLWANRDSLLSRADGASFARDMRASFTVVQGHRHGPVDHDWLYRHPDIAMAHFERLDLAALADAASRADQADGRAGGHPHDELARRRRRRAAGR